MNVLQKAADQLKKQAESLLGLSAFALTPTDHNLTLPDAVTTLKASLPEKTYFGIDLNVRVSGTDGEVQVEYRVWDGKEHLCARSLSEAVNLALAKHRPQPQEALQDAEQVILEATRGY
jgi:hypothetical protein